MLFVVPLKMLLNYLLNLVMSADFLVCLSIRLLFLKDIEHILLSSVRGQALRATPARNRDPGVLLRAAHLGSGLSGFALPPGPTSGPRALRGALLAQIFPSELLQGRARPLLPGAPPTPTPGHVQGWRIVTWQGYLVVYPLPTSQALSWTRGRQPRPAGPLLSW